MGHRLTNLRSHTFSLSAPCFSLVSQSCIMRDPFFPDTVAEDVKLARDSLYRKRNFVMIFSTAQMFPLSNFSNALKMRVIYDFFQLFVFFFFLA